MQQAQQQKSTPGRRRQGRQNNPNAKLYASENDVAILKREKQSTASPSTPHKSSTPKSTNSANQKNNGGRNNRNRGNKNGATPPASSKQNRHTPPFPSQDENGAAIFAGGTFHASPAPSALPMPSFLRQSNGESPLAKSQATPVQEPSPPSTDSEAHDPRLSFATRKEESPLDIFFNADRAEKAQVHRPNSANAAATTHAPFSPPRDSPDRSQKVPQTAPHAQNRRPNFMPRGNSSGISAVELDGTPGQPFGPAFSTPYSQRIRAARSTNPSTQNTPMPTQTQGGDRSDELKRLLGVPLSQQFHGEPNGQVPRQMISHGDQMGGFSAAPAGQGYVPRPYEDTSSQDRQERNPFNHVSAMEDNLRRILKLDSSN